MRDGPQAEPLGSADGVAAAGAVVVDPAGRVLLVRRARPPSAGAWTLPGGRLEPGESPEEAVAREVLEETSLRVRVVCSLGLVVIEREGFRYRIYEHLVVPTGGGPPRAGDDAGDVRWIERTELDTFGVAPDAIAVIDRGLSEARARRIL